MDWLDLAALPDRLLAATCRVPRDLDAVTSIGEEVPPRELGVARGGIDRIWDATRALYRTGIPMLPPEAIDLDLLADPEGVLDLLCEVRPVARPGQRLAYHAFTAGFGLGEVVRHATLEQSHWEFDRTLGLPLPYGLGMMLGGRWASLFGPDTPDAFGHLGFTHIFSWADPQRDLAAAILTSGKPLLPLETLRLYRLLTAIDRAFGARR